MPKRRRDWDELMASETFRHFRALTVDEVRERAELTETRVSTRAPSDVPSERAAWRWLHREMRRARASTVADLRTKVVEKYASRLGYGYFRVRYGRSDAFMPFGSR